MYDENLTPAEYKYISDARTSQVRQLLIEALKEHVPAGYMLSTDPDRMYGNALLALRPAHAAAAGMKMISFLHSIKYRSTTNGGQVIYRPTIESVRACADESASIGTSGAALWSDDKAFGADGRVEITSASSVDLAGMVQFIAAQVCSFAPFTAFEWRRCPHDDGGKWELFDGERHLQSVWKSGNRYGTLMGTCPETLAAAKAEAEAAARFTLVCEQQERLAGLGQLLPSAESDAHDEGEDAPAQSM